MKRLTVFRNNPQKTITDMEKEIKAYFIFGTEAVRLAEEESFSTVKELIEKGEVEGMCVEKTFATQGELDAYRQGIADMDGWMAVMEMDL